MIDLPVHYDKLNQTIDDKNNKVIAILHWQGIQRAVERSHEFGQELCDAINNRDSVAKMVEAVPEYRDASGKIAKPGYGRIVFESKNNGGAK